jgi:hypothetical protein
MCSRECNAPLVLACVWCIQALWDGRRSLSSTLTLRAMLLVLLIFLLLASFVGWGLIPQVWPRVWEFGRFVIVGWRNLLGV